MLVLWCYSSLPHPKAGLEGETGHDAALYTEQVPDVAVAKEQHEDDFCFLLEGVVLAG